MNLRAEDGTVGLKRPASTQWEKVRAFFADLAEKSRPDGGFLAILEVCGMNPWLLDMLKEYGLPGSGGHPADEQAKLLESVPGIGHYSAVAIASQIGDIERPTLIPLGVSGRFLPRKLRAFSSRSPALIIDHFAPALPVPTASLLKTTLCPSADNLLDLWAGSNRHEA